ncbi:MAG: NUDIX hydrolase [SAR202 cluster bacterium]|nr:NUDIX hydrolase [SAR202 cluster bacterium]
MSATRIHIGGRALIVRDGKVLLVRQGMHRGEPFWAMPGGGVEGLETLTDCVRREALQETGLAVYVDGMEHDFMARVAPSPRGCGSGPLAPNRAIGRHHLRTDAGDA